MDYFQRLQSLLEMEQEADRAGYLQLSGTLPVGERRSLGLSWYPVAIRDTEIGRGDYLTVELERTTHHELTHQFRFGMSAGLFSNHDPKNDRIEGIITHQSGHRLKLSLRTDDLPDWCRSGKLGVDAVFDENSYNEMRTALKRAGSLPEKDRAGRLVRVLTGAEKPRFPSVIPSFAHPELNPFQQEAVAKILAAEDLAIVHGPPGTGKTTTLVQAVQALLKNGEGQLLVVAPSNAAVDLLSERLSRAGVRVLRVGNPARVSEDLMALTLDGQLAAHPGAREIKRLKKQAAEYRDLAHKYKRSYGKEERAQRAALFAEARSIAQQVEQHEQYLLDDLLAKAQVITATPVGASHYSVRQRQYGTVVIDEAGQALEPSCWIPVLKGRKLVLAGDHCQLPPTIKSEEAARGGLARTLLEKCVALHPEAVVLLQEQYRMNETIAGYSSAVFYEGKLRAHPSVAHRTLFPGDEPLLFIDTAGCGFEEKYEGVRVSNPEEAAFLVRHLSGLVQQLQEHYRPEDFPDTAVIAPYKQQSEVLQELLAEAALPGLPVARRAANTVDSFQGQERDIIYISLTRSNAEQNIGFLSEIRRMNVAMTRARKKLVVIGDSATLSQFPFYADFIQYAEQQGGYRSAWEYME
ncbi:MAG TPA: AAA domain-containing protein [Chitinophagaceae bacterium]|nr:AAA domain-containing protein [Chitinophagaceae bacterium]